MTTQVVRIPSAGGIAIEADLHPPHPPSGVVVFAQPDPGIAAALGERDFATLVLRPETLEEDAHDIGLLGRRIVDAIDWARRQPALEHMPMALFGSGTGAAAVLVAAAERPEVTHAVISHRGRPDLAGAALPQVEAPTLLIASTQDDGLLEMNRDAMRRMRAHVELELVTDGEGAAQVGDLAAGWCQRYLWSMA